MKWEKAKKQGRFIVRRKKGKRPECELRKKRGLERRNLSRGGKEK